MNQGQLVEYGEPHKLLERQGSWFKSLYEEGGKGDGLGDDGDGDEIMQIAR